ncbi:MAG: heavy metal translocating P-type ATPase [Anaerolineae bacterium]
MTRDADHGAHVDHTGHESMFRQRFWVCLALTAPVLLFSPVVQRWLGFSMPVFTGSAWIAPVFSIVVFGYGGLPFLQMARVELQRRQPGMMTLISLAISVAFVYSLAALVVPGTDTFFWELVTLIDIMLLGHWIEMRSVRQASRALDELAKLLPDTAERVLPDASTEVVAVGDLAVGDIVLVRPGAGIPADGEVTEGESLVNASMITGESMPVSTGPGESVIAGTINSGGGSLRVSVGATGDETALAGIMRLVEEAQQSKSRTQVLADKAAGWLFYAALAVAAITAVAWTLATGFNADVIARVATVLVIACPHALGLAVPLVVAISTSLAARNGILVRDRLALEAAREIDVVLFDKTGTLTQGDYGVVAIETDGSDEHQVLATAAAIEADSEHILARAVRAAAAARGVAVPRATDFQALKGRGVRAVVDGREAHLGGPRLLELLDTTMPAALARFTTERESRGQTVVYLVSDGQARGAFALADVIRPESLVAVDRLHRMGAEVAMLTGDSEAVAKSVAEELGIDHYFAEVLPENKAEVVSGLQAEGKHVAMVGDGVNDAPAMAQADVGIAIGSGTDVAIESAGVILVKSNPLDVVKVIGLSRAGYRKMIQNLVWATGYNVVALPLAAGVLAPQGILLSPAVGAVLMSLSTVIVAINAQLLRRAQAVMA